MKLFSAEYMGHAEMEPYVSIFVKFIYFKKATKFCEISTLLLSYVMPVKSKVGIFQNFVALSEYMNFQEKQVNNRYSPLIRIVRDEKK